MSSDHDHADAQSPPAGPAPAPSSGRATIVFFLILAAGVGLLSLLILLKPGWLKRDDLDSYPQLGSLTLTPVRDEDSALTLADLEGKALLLNFWGTWCPPCVHEFPDILALEQQYHDRTDFRVLAVSCGRGSDDANEIASVRVDTRAFL